MAAHNVYELDPTTNTTNHASGSSSDVYSLAVDPAGGGAVYSKVVRKKKPRAADEPTYANATWSGLVHTKQRPSLQMEGHAGSTTAQDVENVYDTSFQEVRGPAVHQQISTHINVGDTNASTAPAPTMELDWVWKVVFALMTIAVIIMIALVVEKVSNSA